MIEETFTIADGHRALSAGDGIVTGNAAWSFAGETARQFEAHVSKSVPGYASGHDIVLALSDFFVKNDSLCYEIGCSTGALTRQLAQRHGASVRWVGIDVEPDMIEQANAYLTQTSPTPTNVTYCVDNALSFPYEASDFIVAYYTVQFIAPRVRQELIRRIYESLNWGGAFVMFEKVRAPDARFQDIASSVYIDYKLERGYEPNEIIGKSRSLKGVLEPFSTQGNVDMLKRAGFVDVMSIFKHVCFEGFFAIK
ncbi:MULTISPECIES: methyltransferase domain-containing protein [Burkholderia]|uniref:Methyltransferase domain-containing protein n=1 Tax=Burkholderia sola TaxID=2843302 RepID=A0ABV2C978_9BURK|nr:MULTISPECIES: methyltransferase domain-containing protein [unclassified Burkholderia]MBP0607665.1 methyltransferase domain-containing protein [Burkholderia sp. CpTa8-5]MBP0717636.1 methyltransferase domain-containing protein [Burkholderia sp. AcTa6-5]